MSHSFRMMRDEDAEQLSLLIHRNFQRFIAHTYTNRGIRIFRKNTSKQALLWRMRKNQLIIVAESVDPAAGSTAASDRKTISGLVAVRKGNHITLFFVAPEFHGSGIGTGLFLEAATRIKAAIPELRFITVNSSDYALPFYKKLGFTAKSAAFFNRGMKITPMELRL